MNAASLNLIRTSSFPALTPIAAASLKPPLSFFGEKSASSSPRISLQLEINRQISSSPGNGMRRTISESDVSSKSAKFSSSGSRSLRIPEEKCYSSESGVEGGESFDYAGGEVPFEELGFGGGGTRRGKKYGGGGGRGYSNGDHRSKIGEHYREQLKINPGDPLILRNYGKYLHEVENDTKKAEEYYGRAILADPRDGELLSLFAKLIWEIERDDIRAKSYFDQVLCDYLNDCMVLGSYAHFMWESEEDDGEENSMGKMEMTSNALAAF